MAEYIQRSYIRKMAMLEMAYTMETETDAAVVLRMIEDAPAADVAPVVHGRWEGQFPYCSICGEEAIFHDNGTLHGSYFLTDYCPHCGAKMDGDAAD